MTRSAIAPVVGSIRASPLWAGSDAQTWEQSTAIPRDPSGPIAGSELEPEPRSMRQIEPVAASTRITLPVSDHAQAPLASTASSFAHGAASTPNEATISAAAGNDPSDTDAVDAGALALGSTEPTAATGDAAGRVTSRSPPHGLTMATTTSRDQERGQDHPATVRALDRAEVPRVGRRQAGHRWRSQPATGSRSPRA